eukprot:482778-Pyramimonas_sp.AAC.1
MASKSLECSKPPLNKLAWGMVQATGEKGVKLKLKASGSRLMAHVLRYVLECIFPAGTPYQ